MISTGNMPDTAKSGHKVIVIEDDQDINELIAYNLRKEGFRVFSAYDGSEAHQILLKEHFDIVILDIMLPGIDGFELCRELKEKQDPLRTFVVVVSAKSNTQDKLYAHILGADYYLVKPFSVKALTGIIQELVSMLEQDYLVKSR